MLSRKEGRNYVILRQGEKIPSKVNKKRTDDKLKKLQSALKTIKDELQDAYDNDPELYHLMQEEVFSRCECSYRELYDGSIGWIEDAIYSISELKENLAEDDEIPKEEDVVTLRDLGYTKASLSSPDLEFWEKILEDTEEKEVTEEIVYSSLPPAKELGAEPVRRIRTTLWERMAYGKASTSITYKKLRIGKRLMRAIENTRSAMRQKE